MLFGLTPYAADTFGSKLHTDESTIPLIYTLLARPEQRRYYVLQVEPFDTGSVATVERNFGSGISRIPNSDALWKPRLVEAFNVEQHLFGSFGIGGEGRPAFGAIAIAIGDAPDDDELTSFVYDGRLIRVWLGGDPDDGWTFDDYFEVFNGLAEEATWTEKLLTLVARDPSTRLDVPLQKNFYAGDDTDGEGGEDLKGKPKPICLGRPRNFTPVSIDRTTLLYQVHDGEIVSGGVPYDKAEAYTFSGDDPDLATLLAWTQVAGEYRTCDAEGYFRLGSTPNGIVTVDGIQGASDSGTLREKQGAMLKYALQTYGGFTDDEIDLGALAGLDANNREVSFYATEPVTLAELADQILSPSGYRTFDSIGRFTAGRISISDAAGTIAAPNIVSLSRERTPLPAYRISLGYARNWTVLRESDLTIPDDRDLDADFATNEYRRVVAEDSAVWDPDALTGRHPRARDLTLDTLWNDATDAQEEVDSLMDLIGATRDLYRVVCKRIQFRFRAGHTVRLVSDRFGLSGGRLCFVAGIAETTRSGITTLWLWG